MRKARVVTPTRVTRRCAIYTRKSSEEGLEQEFNSLDAQREACEAYIRSQRHEGWVLLPACYDDGGISGGTLERPALQRLLAAIRAGQVDLVIVYKVDRLTRSLADFAKIVEVFDAQGASFVSVTQQFNTATSMGRLTLNMLLSFAQFEREVTGERIRDKIAASKRKGLWMGGTVPLGYDVHERKLVVNEAEAETVRHIYRTYLTLGSVRLLQAQLAEAGIRGKLRPEAVHAKMRGGRELARGALYLILGNRLYRGEIVHKDQVYPGEHEAIVDQALWEAVQARLEENRVARASGIRAQNPSLLAGLVADEHGDRLVPTHTVKQGRRYRYYVSRRLQADIRSPAGTGVRIPAGDLENAVSHRVVSFLADRSAVFAALRDTVTDATTHRHLLERAEQRARAWPDQSRTDRHLLLRGLIAAVSVHPSQVDLLLKPGALLALLDPERAPQQPNDAAETPIPLSIPVALKRAGLEMRLLVQGARDDRDPDPALVKLIARASTMRDRLLREGLSMRELARREKLSSPYVSRVIRLAFLAPEIVTAILKGRQPIELTAEKLVRDSRLPLSWAQQRQQLGFG
jgi:DNA invertase Pin-like site-specific DNA recombinase